jgi:general secretion pathway protein D
MPAVYRWGAIVLHSGLLRAALAFCAPLVILGCHSGQTLEIGLEPAAASPKLARGSKDPLPARLRTDDSGAVYEQNREESSRFTETVSRGTGTFLSEAAAPARRWGEEPGDGITLNLVNVPISEAAKTILGEILGVNYSISNTISGTITIQTTTPIPRTALVDAFEATLKVVQVAIVEGDGFYRLVPTNTAIQAGAPITRNSTGSRIGTRVRIVPLKHVAVQDMQRVLEPVSEQGAVARVDAARNILFLSGTSQQIDEQLKLISIFDVDWMEGMSFALHPVGASDPEAIARELTTIFGTDEQSPMKGLIRFVPNQRLGSVLVISKKPDLLDKAREWIVKLDRAASQSEVQLFVYKIQNRPALELADVLQKVLKAADGDTQSAQRSVAPRYETKTVASRASSTGSSISQALPPNNPITSSPLDNDGKDTSPLGSSNGVRRPPDAAAFSASIARVVADEANNALLIHATPKEYRRILRILRRLDVLPTQVLLEAVIAEVSLNDELRFGIKWYLSKKQHSFTFSERLSGAVASAFPGFSYLFAAASVQVALDALSDITNVKVVSAPSLMVMDNRKATLQIGDQVPIVTQTAQSVTNPDAPVVNSVTLRDTGIILVVTPRVNDNGRVVLDIDQEVSRVTKTTSSGIDSPTIQQRRVTTTVAVGDGETIALGGLIQQREDEVRTQVPILGNLPVVGSVFRNKEDTIERTELLIFIRPQVVRDEYEAHAVTEEFRSRLSMSPMKHVRGNRHYRRDFDRIMR